MTSFDKPWPRSSAKLFPRRVVNGLIRLYQKTLSPDHGLLQPLYPHGACRYHPTCSEYTRQAVAEYGAIRGLALGGRRLLRCHPWAIGGHDPVT